MTSQSLRITPLERNGKTWPRTSSNEYARTHDANESVKNGDQMHQPCSVPGLPLELVYAMWTIRSRWIEEGKVVRNVRNVRQLPMES
jgi:hypothetical protein